MRIPQIRFGYDGFTRALLNKYRKGNEMTIRHAEHRKNPRIEINAPAKILAISGGLRIRKSIDCTVINISEGGALLLAKQRINDAEFYLELQTHRADLHRCCVV